MSELLKKTPMVIVVVSTYLLKKEINKCLKYINVNFFKNSSLNAFILCLLSFAHFVFMCVHLFYYADLTFLAFVVNWSRTCRKLLDIFSRLSINESPVLMMLGCRPCAKWKNYSRLLLLQIRCNESLCNESNLFVIHYYMSLQFCVCGYFMYYFSLLF